MLALFFLGDAVRAAAVPVRRVARRLAPRQGSEDPRPDRPALVETIKTVIRTVLQRATVVAEGEDEPIVRNNMTLAPGRGTTVTVLGSRGTGARNRAPVPG